MTRVLVTGAAGAIGRAVCLSLRDRVDYCVLQTLHGTTFRDRGEGIYELDLREPRQVEQLMAASPDCAIHCAARWTGLNDDFTILDDNIRMTSNLARYLPATASRLVFLSSSAVSRGLPGTYAVAKACEEQIVAARCGTTIRYTIWRPYHVVSPHEAYCPGRSHLVTNLAHAIVERREGQIDVRRNSHAWVRLTWVGDLVAAMRSDLDETPSNRTYDVGATGCLTVAQVAEGIAAGAADAGLIEHRPEILVDTGRPSAPCEAYEPDVCCPTGPLESIRRYLSIRYARVHV